MFYSLSQLLSNIHGWHSVHSRYLMYATRIGLSLANLPSDAESKPRRVGDNERKPRLLADLG